MPVHAAVVIAVSALFLTTLSGLTSAIRIRYKIFVGYGERTDLQRLSRSHGVSLEHLMPMLLLLLVLELCGADHRIIDGFGIAILVSRFVHVFGFLRGIPRIRSFGMGLTYITELLLAVMLLVQVSRLG